jgi:multidrug efflux pump subunit AcrB
VRQLAADIDAVLKGIPGIKGWVTIGGYSALDSAKLANVVTAFVMYQDWDQRPPGFSQTNLLPELQKKLLSIRNAQVAVLPPSPIPGLGNAFGFQMVIEDRWEPGSGELQQAVQQIIGTAQNRPVFCASVSPPSAPTARSSIWISTERWRSRWGHDQRCLQNLADLFRLDLRQSVQQVQPELPGPSAS